MIDVEQASRIALLIAVVAVAGIAATGAWIWRWATAGYVLAYQPRRRTPWGLGGATLAVLLTLFAAVMALGAGDDAAAQEKMAADEFASRVIIMGAIQLGLAVAIVAALVLALGATVRDLGLPTSLTQLVKDTGLGIWIALAALVPTYVVQFAAMQILGIPPAHPLLDRMQSDPEPMVFIAAMMAAVVVAPLFEELVFRLLLQGGLERWEDERVAWPHSQRTTRAEAIEAEDEETPPAHSLAPGGKHLQPYANPETADAMAPTGAGAVVGLRHGWAPILVSSFVFALAHIGNGPSPIALFIFALFLGYAYQRTHRMVPVIVAHLVLNLISVSVMILALSKPEVVN